MANEDKQEASRRKMFIKAAHIVIKDWPGYAADIPRLKIECETDRHYIRCRQESIDNLKVVWTAARAGTASMKDFESAVTEWWVRHIQAFRCFNIRLSKGKL